MKWNKNINKRKQTVKLTNKEVWIELPRPENPPNTSVWHTETLNSYFDHIRSHQQCILWPPPLEIDPVTTDCRAKTPQLSQQFISHTSCWVSVLQSVNIPAVLRINFFFITDFCPHLGSFLLFFLTTFRPNFTSGLLQVINRDLG